MFDDLSCILYPQGQGLGITFLLHIAWCSGRQHIKFKVILKINITLLLPNESKLLQTAVTQFSGTGVRVD